MAANYEAPPAPFGLSGEPETRECCGNVSPGEGLHNSREREGGRGGGGGWRVPAAAAARQAGCWEVGEAGEGGRTQRLDPSHTAPPIRPPTARAPRVNGFRRLPPALVACSAGLSSSSGPLDGRSCRGLRDTEGAAQGVL